jgi:hypothetical protein
LLMSFGSKVLSVPRRRCCPRIHVTSSRRGTRGCRAGTDVGRCRRTATRCAVRSCGPCGVSRMCLAIRRIDGAHGFDVARDAAAAVRRIRAPLELARQRQSRVTRWPPFSSSPGTWQPSQGDSGAAKGTFLGAACGMMADLVLGTTRTGPVALIGRFCSRGLTTA